MAPLKRISPSRFLLFRGCKLRACLESNRLPGLLPRSPSAHCGIIIHKIFEAADERITNEEDNFEECWTRYLTIEEKEMANSWLERHLVPLKKSTPKYELKKYQCLLAIKSMFKKRKLGARYNSINKISREMWLETEDKTIGGYVDAIISTSSGDHIIDYKTGNIIEKNGDKLCVSETYKIQLQLYAAIYYSAYGIWPISLKINGIDETLYEIDFDKENCVRLLNEARLRINEINSIIASVKNFSDINELLSSPSPENCRFCLYRPACKSYLEMSEANSPADWPRDIIGTIIEKKILGNGLMLIRVADNCIGSDVITVRGLHPSRHPALNSESTEIAVFSMAYDGSPNNFKEGILTTIYNVN